MIKTIVSDITTLKVDSIVNAANPSLLGGGGVDGAIHRAGGPSILKECQNIRNTIYKDGLPIGKAISTSAGDLPCKYVIHTVGPVYFEYDEQKEAEKLLANCYLSSLKEAIRLECKTIAFPAISTGVYGYPKGEAAKVAYPTVKNFIDNTSLEVYFVFFSNEDKEIFEKSIVEVL